MPQHAICSYFLSSTTPAMHALTPGNRSSSVPCDAGTWRRWQTAPRQTTVLSSSVQTTAVTAVKTDTIRGVVCPPCFDVTVSAKSSLVSSPRASSPRCLQKVSCHVSVFSALGNISVVMIVNTFFLPDQLRPLLFFLLFFGFEFFVVRVRARACRTCIPRVAREAVRLLRLQCLQCRPLYFRLASTNSV